MWNHLILMGGGDMSWPVVVTHDIILPTAGVAQKEESKETAKRKGERRRRKLTAYGDSTHNLTKAREKKAAKLGRAWRDGRIGSSVKAMWAKSETYSHNEGGGACRRWRPSKKRCHSNDKSCHSIGISWYQCRWWRHVAKWAPYVYYTAAKRQPSWRQATPALASAYLRWRKGGKT